jgi:hypothetical protein
MRLSFVFVATIAASAPLFAQTVPITKGSLTIGLKPFTAIPSADGPAQDLVPANDGTGNVYIATRNGDILTATPGGQLSTFLNLSTAGISVYTGGEGGFPGLAFSPTYAQPGTPGFGKFYTFTTEPFSASGPAADFSQPELFPTTSVAPNNQIVIREWTANPATGVVNPTSRALLRIDHPESNHQGGALVFGPDGDLYIGLGDGGGANDNNGGATSTTDGHTNSTGNAQDTSVVFGKILRIDPRGNNSANGQYGIPPSNPFVGQPGKLAEIYAYGLRNPYRINFDPASGKLYAGDVGQSAQEEIDIIQNGGNYGWVFREGLRDNTADSGRSLPPGFTSLTPIAEYTHIDGDAVQGGFVYHGAGIPALDGKYIFGDYQGTAGTGRLFYMDAAGGTISEFNYSTLNGDVVPPSGLFGFGDDASGELYALFDNGQIDKLTGVPEPSLACLAVLSPMILMRRKRLSCRAAAAR